MVKRLQGENEIEIGGRKFLSGMSEDGLFVLWPCARCGGTGEWYYRSALGHKLCLLCRGNRGQWLRREQIEKRLKDGAKRAEARKAAHARRERERRLGNLWLAKKTLAEKPELRAALAGAPARDPRRDMARKLVQWGTLTEKQIAFAVRLAQPKPAEAAKIDLPAGQARVDLLGTVLSIKESFGDYGAQLKMLVEVVGEGGVYRVFGTIPSDIVRDVKRGSIVRFSAKLQRKEFGFGFFSRPTKAEIVGEASE